LRKNEAKILVRLSLKGWGDFFYGLTAQAAESKVKAV